MKNFDLFGTQARFQLIVEKDRRGNGINICFVDVQDQFNLIRGTKTVPFSLPTGTAFVPFISDGVDVARLLFDDKLAIPDNHPDSKATQEMLDKREDGIFMRFDVERLKEFDAQGVTRYSKKVGIPTDDLEDCFMIAEGNWGGEDSMIDYFANKSEASVEYGL